MDQKKKLSVVIEHWIEHNESHMGEYKKWAQTAGELGLIWLGLRSKRQWGNCLNPTNTWRRL